jgi:hypothetical protein
MNAWSLTSTSLTCEVMLRHRDKFRFTLSYGCKRRENNIKMYLKINMGMRFGYICKIKYKTRKLCGSVKNRSGLPVQCLDYRLDEWGSIPGRDKGRFL